MPLTYAWLAAFATVAILLLYEAAVLLAQRSQPKSLARSAHASLREEWFAAVSAHPGSEILAVQTLRNSLMSATTFIVYPLAGPVASVVVVIVLRSFDRVSSASAGSSDSI